MTPERHREIGDLYYAVQQLQVARRAAFLKRVCSGDDELRREVESLLAFEEQSEELMKTRAWDGLAFGLMMTGPAERKVDPSQPPARGLDLDNPACSSEIPNYAPVTDKDYKDKSLAQDKHKIGVRRPFGTRIVQLASHRSNWPWLLLAGTIGAVLTIGALTLWRIRSQGREEAGSPQSAPFSAVERTLNYSLIVRKDAKRYPESKPFYSAGDTVLTYGDEVRFLVSSPQTGFLYIINEGSALTNGLPEYNFLFPDGSTQDPLEVVANQLFQIPQSSRQPEEDWFVVDAEQGLERIWLVWAAESVPALEQVRVWANPRDKGQIADPEQIRAVAGFLKAQLVTTPAVDSGGNDRRMTLKGGAGPLVGLLRLWHRG